MDGRRSRGSVRGDMATAGAARGAQHTWHTGRGGTRRCTRRAGSSTRAGGTRGSEPGAHARRGGGRLLSYRRGPKGESGGGGKEAAAARACPGRLRTPGSSSCPGGPVDAPSHALPRRGRWAARGADGRRRATRAPRRHSLAAPPATGLLLFADGRVPLLACLPVGNCSLLLLGPWEEGGLLPFRAFQPPSPHRLGAIWGIAEGVGETRFTGCTSVRANNADVWCGVRTMKEPAGRLCVFVPLVQSCLRSCLRYIFTSLLGCSSFMMATCTRWLLLTEHAALTITSSSVRRTR